MAASNLRVPGCSSGDQHLSEGGPLLSPFHRRSRCCPTRRGGRRSRAGRRWWRRTPRRSAGRGGGGGQVDAGDAPAFDRSPACAAEVGVARRVRRGVCASVGAAQGGRVPAGDAGDDAEVDDLDRLGVGAMAVGALVLVAEALRAASARPRPERAGRRGRRSARTPGRRSADRRSGRRRSGLRRRALGGQSSLARAPPGRRRRGRASPGRGGERTEEGLHEVLLVLGREQTAVAENRPGAGGTTTRRMPSSRAMPAAWIGPLPPKASSAKSRGSRPR